MKGLQAKGMVEAIQEFVDKGRPLLGICLGMQMLMDQSHEFGLHKGLSLIPGEVKPLAKALKDSSLKVPHIGWSGLKPSQAAWDNSILARTPVNSPMYFVHSFYADPVDPAHRLAVTSYGSVEFASVIAKDNVCGCQFHPEKSAGLGLRIMEQFIHWR
jgi:glutamine amidotransferase